MVFQRVWASRCPHVWDCWEDVGVKWMIRDIPSEDDDEAIEILVKHLCPDEILCRFNDIVSDTVSMETLKAFWRRNLNERMSLGCYQEKDGRSKLVGLIVCTVLCQGDKVLNEVDIKGKAWKNLYNAMKLCDGKVDALKTLDIDMLLYGMGLVVHRDYRGSRLGSRLLTAITPTNDNVGIIIREGHQSTESLNTAIQKNDVIAERHLWANSEPLGLHHCIKGALMICTTAESQKSAERVGFTTAAAVIFKDLADAGLEYPKDETAVMKFMIKKFTYELI